MKIFLYLSILLFLLSCKDSGNEAISKNVAAIKQEKASISKIDKIHNSLLENAKLTVLILPPYDLIANRGISPNISKYLEIEISADTNLTVLNFPHKKLHNVAYQNVFDKKYCKTIADKVKTDVIVMSKLEQMTETGQMNLDRWNLSIKIYNSKTGVQKNSSITAHGLTNDEIKLLLSSKQNILSTEIKNNR
ncbi:MAG TPA: hypothetical protein VGQ04_20310 [Chitinophagaceae bacterium]|jgi:hypothetical protein|nr:hypothetical protein [Chitinophagaceae bacterium]